jgi:hypothetical protein
LHERYGNLIEEKARYYIDQFEAKCMGQEVTCFLFSDLVLLANVRVNGRELLRIKLHKYSHVQIAGNSRLFKNRLFLYGKRLCVHLTFMSKIIRNQVYEAVYNLIQSIDAN